MSFLTAVVPTSDGTAEREIRPETELEASRR